MPDEAETDQRRGAGRWGKIADLPADKGGWPQSADSGRRQEKSNKESSPPAYYDLSMLKPPVWTPEVGVYFFLGGLSAGAFILARLAERFGGEAYRGLTRTGTAIAVLAALPCAPLLIVDLGDRKRFHHMLRIWKPESPMNFGSWVLTGYTACAVLAELREWIRARRQGETLHGAARGADETLGVLTDIAGVPLALLLAGYTGVLLSTTATPVWSKNPYIGALFSASAMAAGAGAIKVVLDAKTHEETPGKEALAKVETMARILETVAHVGYIATAGSLAKPLTQGPQRAQYWGGAVAAGVIVPEILEKLPAPKKLRPWMKLAGGIISLVGGYALRAAFVSAGRPSATDPEAARQNSRPKNGATP